MVLLVPLRTCQGRVHQLQLTGPGCTSPVPVHSLQMLSIPLQADFFVHVDLLHVAVWSRVFLRIHSVQTHMPSY